VVKVTITQGIDEYLDYLQTVARRSPNTITAYRFDLARFLRFLENQGDTDLAQVDPALIERWTASMRHLSDATVRRALNSLSGLFKWAVRFGHAQANPLDQVHRPKTRRRIPKTPRPEEVQALLDATRSPTERAALLALATSGLRRAELLALTWPDVDLPNRRLRIRGKGDKQREVLIFDDLLPPLYALHAEHRFPASGPVFRGRQGGPLQISTLARWFSHWLQAAELTAAGYTLHSLRRFAAKRWLDSGLNIRHVQMLLGHESVQTTILYLNYDLDEIQRAAATVDFRLRPLTTA
jgi:integrase/recombinase XerC